MNKNELQQTAASLLRSDQQATLRTQRITALYARAAAIAARCIVQPPAPRPAWQLRLDRIVTSRLYGYPLMLLLLAILLWLTLFGANSLSEAIAPLLASGEFWLSQGLALAGSPVWLQQLLCEGAYRALAWVVAVMLPPMAIFFPLFTILEDLGYLPRLAFNLDYWFQRCRACGKQALTMCMGFGCNAAGVIACRIIDSPRERLIALVTNNFMPCNGRFPTLIALSTLYLAPLSAPEWQTLTAALAVTGFVLLGIGITFVCSWLLSHTLLKGQASCLIMELPPYRRPQIGPILYRSLLDRTWFVLRRAICMAAPAGAIIWLLAHSQTGGQSWLALAAAWLQPFAQQLGLDGYILLAFILGLPANEIVIPILLMGYLGADSLQEIDSLAAWQTLFNAHGWTTLTAVNTMLFSLLHWPCTTTLLSLYKESGSLRWTAVALFLPTLIACLVCFATHQISRYLAIF